MIGVELLMLTVTLALWSGCMRALGLVLSICSRTSPPRFLRTVVYVNLTVTVCPAATLGTLVWINWLP